MATTGSLACNPAAITISGPTTCQPVNWFRPQTILSGEFSEAEKAFLFTRETGKTSYDQTLVGASINGNLFALPAGDVGFVFGVEGRKDSIDERVGSPVSIMPKGLLDKLTRDEILDLVAYVAARGDEASALFSPDGCPHHPAPGVPASR